MSYISSCSTKVTKRNFNNMPKKIFVHYGVGCMKAALCNDTMCYEQCAMNRVHNANKQCLTFIVLAAIDVHYMFCLVEISCNVDR